MDDNIHYYIYTGKTPYFQNKLLISCSIINRKYFDDKENHDKDLIIISLYKDYKYYIENNQISFNVFPFSKNILKEIPEEEVLMMILAGEV